MSSRGGGRRGRGARGGGGGAAKKKAGGKGGRAKNVAPEEDPQDIRGPDDQEQDLGMDQGLEQGAAGGMTQSQSQQAHEEPNSEGEEVPGPLPETDEVQDNVYEPEKQRVENLIYRFFEAHEHFYNRKCDAYRNNKLKAKQLMTLCADLGGEWTRKFLQSISPKIMHIYFSLQSNINIVFPLCMLQLTQS